MLHGFPQGRYNVTVADENHRERLTDVTLEDSPDHTAVIEVGNGTLSLTTGL